MELLFILAEAASQKTLHKHITGSQFSSAGKRAQYHNYYGSEFIAYNVLEI